MSVIWDDENFEKIQTALSPKQLKVVNFMFGQCMKADPEMKKAPPALLRRVIIQRLCEATYEEEHADVGQVQDGGS